VFRIDTADNNPTLPTPSAVGTQGYFQPGNPGTGTPATTLTSEWANAVQEELAWAIETFGVVLDKASAVQLAGILSDRIKAIRCHTSDTGELTTAFLRAVLAATDSRASGTNAIVAACDDMHASGQSSAAVAAESSSSTAQVVAALRSMVAACLDCGTVGSGGREAAIIGSELCDTTSTARAAVLLAALYGSITGTRCAVVASEGTSGVKVGATGTNALVGASKRSSGSVDNAGAESAILAVLDSYISAGVTRAILAGARGSYIDDGDAVGLIAARDSRVDGGSPQQALLAASNTCKLGGGANVALIGSINVELHGRSNGVGGGYHGSAPTFSGTTQNLKWWLDSELGEGNATAWNTGGADYAELFENATAGEIPVGSLVALEGRRVRATRAGDRILGVVSATPGVVGNAAELGWSGQYVRDVWGRIETRAVEWVRWRDRTGAIVYDGPLASARKPPKSAQRYTKMTPVESPHYDPTRPYIGRRQRPAEWTVVALRGQVRVRVDRSVTPGCFVAAGDGGIGTRERSDSWLQVMEIVAPWTAEQGFGVALVII
jgi:hypothetical protein